MTGNEGGAVFQSLEGILGRVRAPFGVHCGPSGVLGDRLEHIFTIDLKALEHILGVGGIPQADPLEHIFAIHLLVFT